MKVTVFSGSHKGREGNTLIIVEEFLKGAEEAGAETENVILAEKNIRYCKGKFECWLKTPGKCSIHDDMDDLLPRFLDSDIAVFACPVYFKRQCSGCDEKLTIINLLLSFCYF